MQSLRCFIFDLDGTLVFNKHANLLAYQAAFKQAGLQLSEADFAGHFAEGGNIKDIYRTCVTRLGAPYNEQQLQDIRDYKAKTYADHFHHIQQNHAIIGLLKALAPHYHTALATTAHEQNARGVLDHFGLTDLFDYFVFGSDVKMLKPDPECHHKIAKHFGVKPEECLIFEDSPRGLAAAMAFGGHVCKVVQ